MAPSQRRYWHFYWPLTLMWIVIFWGRLAQNYVLLGYPEGVRELAVFALARAAFGPFRAGLIFVPQMSNVLVRGRKSLAATLRFMLTLALLMTLPLGLLAWTPLGGRLLPLIYDVAPQQIELIVVYMRYFTPLILLYGLSAYFVGLLIQAERTGVVTTLRAVMLGLLVGILLLGRHLGWEPVTTIGLSLLLPRVVHVVLAGVLLVPFHKRHAPEEDRSLAQGDVAAYYLPMLCNAILFAATRPIIFGFLTALSTHSGVSASRVEIMVAGVSLAFAFGMLFHGSVNQFRHLFVTFGEEDRRGVRRFMARVTLVITGLMLVAVASPAARLFFRYLQGATGETLRVAVQAVWPLCLAPAAIGFRNYFHGMAMVHRRTGGMAAGGLVRNGSAALCAGLLMAVGLYNHVTAAAMLVVAFISEGLTVMAWTRGWRRELRNGPSG